MVNSRGSVGFITVKGIDTALERTVSDLEKAVVAGKLADLEPTGDDP
jgi:hypothetical protein